MMHAGAQWFSVYDFMTKACKYANAGASARNAYRDLISDSSEYKDEVVGSAYYLKFLGKGQRETPA